MRVQVSNNGGGAWTTLETFTGTFTAESRAYDIGAFIAAKTRVRFIHVTGYTAARIRSSSNNVTDPEPEPAGGAWEVQVDMSSAVTAGDDINDFGLRADDGDASGSDGTERLLRLSDQLWKQRSRNPIPETTSSSPT